MKKTILFSILAIFVIGVSASLLNNDDGENPNKTPMTVYKSSSCGCCGIWSSYIGKKSITFEV